MDRRTFLQCASAITAISSLSGCAAFGATGKGKGYHLSLYSIPGNDLAKSASLDAEEYTDEQRSIVEATANDGEARTYGYRPIDDGAYVAYEGQYYRVAVEETGTKTLRRTTLRGEIASRSESEAKAVEMTTYPQDDRKAVRTAVSTADESDDRFYVFHGRSAEESALLPEPEHGYVKYNDQIIHLVVEERAVSETEYTYTLEQIADDEAAFAKYAREGLLNATFRSDALSEKQRGILKEAIESEDYTEYGEPSDDYEALLKRLSDDGNVPEDHLSGYIQYDGRYYRVSFSVSVP